MALQVHQPTFPNPNRKEPVYLTVMMASSASSEVTKFGFSLPIHRDLFSYESLCDDLVKELLVGVQMPQNFFNGRDCDMVEKLSRLVRRATTKYYFGSYICVVIMVYEATCRYTITNFRYDEFPESDMIEMICEVGECCVAEDADKCAICLEEFTSDIHHSHAAEYVLPCSHGYHESCIMKWFEMSDTCPKCRFPCN